MTLTEALRKLHAAGKIRHSILPGMLSASSPARAQSPGCLPEEDSIDLADPATRGCLLALIRQATQNPHVHTCPEDRIDLNEWLVYAPERGGVCEVLGLADTEAEAIVNALVRLAKGL